MTVGTMSQNEIDIIQAQEELKLVENPEIITLLEDTAKKVKTMVCENHKQRKGGKPKKQKENNKLPESPLESVMEIKQLLGSNKINGSKPRIIKKINDDLATVPDDVKELVEIVLGINLNAETNK